MQEIFVCDLTTSKMRPPKRESVAPQTKRK